MSSRVPVGTRVEQPRLICLMYHRFVKEDTFTLLGEDRRRFAVGDEGFRAQLEGLLRSGVRFIRLEELRELLNGGRMLQCHEALITIDDGCVSAYTLAVPVLQALGLPACFCVTAQEDAPAFSSEVIGEARMTDRMISDLARTDLYSVASHGLTHRPLRSLSDAELGVELRRSREILEKLTDRKVDALATPGGWHDGRVARLAKAAGYSLVFNSRAACVSAKTDSLAIPRINVRGSATASELASLFSGSSLLKRQAASVLKSLPGRILGPKLWLPIRSALLKTLPRRVTGRGLIWLGIGGSLLGGVIQAA